MKNSDICFLMGAIYLAQALPTDIAKVLGMLCFALAFALQCVGR